MVASQRDPHPGVHHRDGMGEGSPCRNLDCGADESAAGQTLDVAHVLGWGDLAVDHKGGLMQCHARSADVHHWDAIDGSRGQDGDAVQLGG
jgi:hypothetical protein